MQVMRANGGLAPVDLERFWNEQEKASKNPFGRDIAQVALGIGMSSECVFDELGVEEDVWKYDHDPEWARSLNKAYNDKSEKIVGRRFLPDTFPDPSLQYLQYPSVKKLSDVFEAREEWRSGSWWLHQSAHTPDELKALLDRVEARDIRKFILPGNWDEAKERLMPRGIRPPLYRGQRGPVTFATSIYGVENLIFLIMDQPDLAVRFSNAILRTMLEIARVMDEEAGFTNATAPRGFGFADDNCCMLNPEMYELFGYPILKEVFERYSPDPNDGRSQHSDSNMAHLLPILGRLNLTWVNFGPTLTVAEIRRHCPKAVILGQLAPFTFSRNEEENIIREFLRDFEMAREKRGLLFGTAGSINNGSRLTGLRLIMSTIQHFGRYDGNCGD